MGKLNDFIVKIKEKPFIKSLINDLNSDVYAVGGVVRDLILNKPNKDIDLIVRKVPIDTLIKQLEKFGRVDVVGKSFGVLKFIDSDGLDYDIALPRREKPTGEGGYHGFDVQSDPNLSIEDDLSRRDAKFNAMAINLNTGKFIDPLGGLNDIENKQISAANSEAFSDDPLRMLRIIGFASRFDFTIEPETMKMIQGNASRIKEIPSERILTEFDKIVKKGDKFMGADLLVKSGLFQQIFGSNVGINKADPWNQIKTIAEFLFMLSKDVIDNVPEFYLKRFGGKDAKSDIIFRETKAIDYAFKNSNVRNNFEARAIASNVYTMFPQALQSQILPQSIKNAAQELLQGKYPKNRTELAVRGDDLVALGLKHAQVGDTINMMLLKVFSDKVKNNKEDLLALVNSGDKPIEQEGVADKYAEREFNIPDPNAEKNVQAMSAMQKEIEKPIGFAKSIPVYLNPKSLINFDANVRAVSDINGNLYVAQKNGDISHAHIGLLFKLPSVMDIYSSKLNYLLMHRIGVSNSFGMGDSTDRLLVSMHDDSRAIELANAVMKKNPQYDIYLDYYEDVTL
jgi:tRNA nucleotidyltransferase/poly(A) polymerase